MVPFQGDNVALDLGQDRRGIKAVWRSEGRVVIVIGPEQAIGIADLVIQPRGEEIFVYHSCRCEDEVGYVRVVRVDRPVGVLKDRQVLRRNHVIHASRRSSGSQVCLRSGMRARAREDGLSGEDSQPRILRRNG